MADEYVSGYKRKDGTRVKSYKRKKRPKGKNIKRRKIDYKPRYREVDEYGVLR